MVAANRKVPHQILGQLAQEHPDHELIEFTDDRAYTAGELHREAQRVAAGLQKAGIEPGDRVALLIGNRIEFLNWWLGAAMRGTVSVPLNTAMRGSVLEHMLGLSSPSIVVTETEFAADVHGALANLDIDPLVLEFGRDQQSEAFTRFFENIGEPTPVDVSPSTFASIMFTSGTTGPSKGVMWPHRLSLGMADNSMTVMNHSSSDVLFTCLPLFHANGLCTSFLPTLMVRAKLVVAPRFSASHFWDWIRTSDATITNMLGSIAPLLWKRDPGPEERDHRLRKALVIPPPSGYVDAFEERFNLECTQLYGLTDVGIPLGVPDGERNVESCGKPLPGWECQIVDEHDSPLSDGVAGELVVRPLEPFMSQLGYYGMPDATLAAWRNLWLHTGDVMMRDAEGWYYFVDRAKDAIRRSGENISSYEVEQVILSHESVEDVASFGVPAEFGEDEVMAVVVLREDYRETGPREIVLWCRERLPYFAVPRYIEFVDELPRTATAKVKKAVLRTRGVTGSTFDAGPTNKRSRQ